MLCGVASASGRYDALRKLKWAETLTEGSTVFVNIPAFPTAAKGTLHYVGSLSDETGIKFGVELLVCRNGFKIIHKIFVCHICKRNLNR